MLNLYAQIYNYDAHYEIKENLMLLYEDIKDNILKGKYNVDITELEYSTNFKHDIACQRHYLDTLFRHDCIMYAKSYAKKYNKSIKDSKIDSILFNVSNKIQTLKILQKYLTNCE